MTMQRRQFLTTGLLTAGASALPSRALATEGPPAAPREFDVTMTIDLPEVGGPAQLWAPLFETTGGWQKVIGTTTEGTGRIALERDPVHGSPFLHGQWQAGDGPRSVRITQRVATWERMASDASPPLTAAERAFWTRSTPELPTGGLVGRTARAIVGTRQEPREKARAIYDWVVANTWRDPKVAGCGDGDVALMLREHRMGGKCVDINALMVALCRAAGIPARELYGLRLADSRRFRSLGRSGTVTGAQHCRAEIWLDDAGWFAVDPADVRKAILEEKLAADGPEIIALADALFGGAEGNWAAYNSATGIRLPGATKHQKFSFLMYVCAESNGIVANCLDAANFRYAITSKEVLG